MENPLILFLCNIFSAQSYSSSELRTENTLVVCTGIFSCIFREPRLISLTAHLSMCSSDYFLHLVQIKTLAQCLWIQFISSPFSSPLTYPRSVKNVFIFLFFGPLHISM